MENGQECESGEFGSKCGNERIAVIAVLVKKKMVFFKAKCT